MNVTSTRPSSPTWATRGYLLWLAAANVSQLGNGVLAFAITWTATGLSPGLAGTMAALGLAPTVALLLLGGSLGDRVGQRRLLLFTTAAEVAQYLALWLLLGRTLHLGILLVANAIAVGILQGLAAPSINVIGRQYVAPEHVRPAISVSSTAGSLVRIVAPALGAACLAALGLRNTVLLQAASFAGILLLLVLVKPQHEPPRHAGGAPGVHRAVWAGMRSVGSDPAASALLVATALVAGAILPFTGLGLPLLARAHNWSAASAGMLAAAWTLGSVATTVFLTARYAKRPDAAPTGMVAGPGLAAVALAAIAVCPNREECAALCALTGIGTAMFTAHVSPTLVGLAPPDQQSRWAAVTVLAQFLPLLAINPLFGTATQHLNITAPIWGLAALAALGAMASARARQALDRKTTH